jgi:hypothetical protein
MRAGISRPILITAAASAIARHKTSNGSVSISLTPAFRPVTTHCCTASAVLTASFIVPTQPVTIDEVSQFFRKRSQAMVFFLIRDLPGHLIDIRMRDRGRSVASAPREFSRDQFV